MPNRKQSTDRKLDQILKLLRILLTPDAQHAYQKSLAADAKSECRKKAIQVVKGIKKPKLTDLDKAELRLRTILHEGMES